MGRVYVYNPVSCNVCYTVYVRKNNEKPSKKEIEARRAYKALVQQTVRNSSTIVFPKDVLQESAKIPETINETEINKRRDFRATPTCTIDPSDAKDFDDALSVKKLEGGLHEIGIHIADVAHYVTTGKPIDKEAKERGTSIYLANTVIPMLPEKLSNDLCSLKEGVDRLTFSVVVTITPNFTIKDVWFGKGIINSQKRFTYEEAQHVLDIKKGFMVEELLFLEKYTTFLTKERETNGALLLEDSEVRFTYDENNYPVDVYVKERLTTHKLVEECMLLANRLVAESIPAKEPFVYRIHDTPDTEKLNIVRVRAQEYNMSLPKKIDNHVLNMFIGSIQDTDVKGLFSKLIMRSMAKAVYSSKNIGHYGLAFKKYTHFTSPIRRYPDLVAHRMLLQKLEKKTRPIDKKKFEEELVYLSLCERRAQDMERASQKDMQVLYMEKHIGEERLGVVTGLNEYGIYVADKHSLSEGFIGATSLGKKWKWNNKADFWKSQDMEKIKIGDHLVFKVEKVNFERGFIDYSLIQKHETKN